MKLHVFPLTLSLEPSPHPHPWKNCLVVFWDHQKLVPGAERLGATDLRTLLNTISQGQLLRTRVEPSTATQGLPTGIYIVGNKKVIVK